MELPGNDIPRFGIRQVCAVYFKRGFAAIQPGDKQRCSHIARLPGGFGVRLHNGGTGIGLPCQALGRFYHGQLVGSAPHQASQQPCHGGQRKAGRPALGKGSKEEQRYKKCRRQQRGQRRQVRRGHVGRVLVTGEGDHQQSHDLDHRDAEVAAARVQTQRPTLVAAREERGDVGHRRGEVPAPDPGRGTDQQENPQRRARLLHEVPGQQRRDEQHRRAEHRPVPPAEPGHRRGVGQPEHRAHQRGGHPEQELLPGVEPQADPR